MLAQKIFTILFTDGFISCKRGFLLFISPKGNARSLTKW